MADKETLPAPVVDLEAEMAALRASNAPVVYFDLVTTQGAYAGMGNMTLECTLHTGTPAGQSVNRRQVTAHLRFPLGCIASLRASLDAIELLAQPPASGEKN